MPDADNIVGIWHNVVMECLCASIDLFNFGCLCGSLAKQENLHLFFNGCDYVIARNIYHAEKLLAQEEMDPYDGRFAQLNDDALITFNIGGPDGETRRAKEWADSIGEGYLLSIN